MYPERRRFRRNANVSFVGATVLPRVANLAETHNDSGITPFTIPPTLFRRCVESFIRRRIAPLPLNSRAIKTRHDFRRSLKRHYHHPRGAAAKERREFGIMYRPATGEMYYSSLWLLMSFLTIRRTHPLLRAFKCAANFDVRILLPLVQHRIPLTVALILPSRAIFKFS